MKPRCVLPPENSDTGSGNTGTGSGNTSSNKWSYSDAVNLNTYSEKATSNMNKAVGYTNDAINASSTYKVLYNQYAISYVNIAKGYLSNMKSLADGRAELTLTNTNANYSTLQEKINYAYNLCDEIAKLEITSGNYAMYEDKISEIAWDIYMECLGIQKLSVDLIGTFS